VPHSRHLFKENPRFVQNFKSKPNSLKGNFQLILFLISETMFKVWHSAGKNHHFISQKCMYPKLTSKT
jgi:hypothetical protein